MIISTTSFEVIFLCVCSHSGSVCLPMHLLDCLSACLRASLPTCLSNTGLYGCHCESISRRITFISKKYDANGKDGWLAGCWLFMSLWSNWLFETDSIMSPLSRQASLWQCFQRLKPHRWVFGRYFTLLNIWYFAMLSSYIYFLFLSLSVGGQMFLTSVKKVRGQRKAKENTDSVILSLVRSLPIYSVDTSRNVRRQK